ncbi:potassium/proton antiporter [Mesorhizobium australicum]|uniref:Potassium/proton antiporter, CPA1 family n=1 Tax=Mesorhizobium australicum TaxID=536018 RepID=A0A1X7PXT0_9HYPH|nr:potassium/proton antiporter [Mesorhizobium australicum]SMH57019.1 potassium/proton antiporter, CPA1 family [Mesorhizobium australicum]
MFEGVYLVTLIGTAMVLAAAFSSLIAFRFGAPLLLLFLGIGLLAGQDGLGIPFDNAAASYFIGSIALAVILFDSGFGTALSSLRLAAPPALSLATLGVILTAGLFGVFAFAITDLNWLESFLLGSIVASTDAAAVFFLLRAGNLHIRERVRNTLEIESGSNDPIAIFLTIAFVELIAAGAAVQPGELAIGVVLGFLREMGVGVFAGLIGGRLIVMFVNRLKLDPGLLPIFVITVALVLFGITGAVHGSGFVAVYTAGLVAGNSGMRSTATLKRFQDGISWLAQIIMFLVLGLFATPSQFISILPVAIALSLFLIFIARPVAVSLCLLPFRFARAETAFISWVGLRGAVSILLALAPIIGGLENGRELFNIAFIVVLVSLLVQGWTIGPVARRLGLIIPPRSGPLDKVELELPGSAHHELLAYRVAAGSPVARGGRIPRWARPSLVIREGRSLKPQDAGRLLADDLVYIFVSDRYPRLLDRLFATKVSLAADDEEFFGAFTVEPDHLASEISAAYGAELREGEADLTIAQLMLARLGGHAEYADRVLLGPIELIVRDTDDKGVIDSVGLSLEPQELAPSMPLLLTAGEIKDRIAAFLRRRGVKASSGEPSPPAS